ncbi:VOC family protein [Flaviflexus huanghaiensis]|uniref:VOC family protein n=1 Tax=Flaviflexus huanghaiensis TaxID=1111473 RepID=UPI0015FC4553|nr:glyoxalase/bleomycin resistance/extradiol dioxygenase family protein [Flaviflexus huanghaiensis]
MTLRHSLYLTFPGNAAEVLTYYRSVFGGELTMMLYSEMGNLDEYPFNPDPDWVAHGELRGIVNVSGGDGEVKALGSQVYSMVLYGDDVEEGRALLERLAEDGGEKIMDYEQAPWGDWYGQVRDRFGVTWAVAATDR